MEIIVEGKGVEYFTPDEVKITITFYAKAGTYEEVLKKGVHGVDVFINQILKLNGFKKEDMKTRSFVIKEERIYDAETKKYNFDGYSFNQYASIKFDYDKTRFAKLLESISKLENAPMCNAAFGVKDEKDCRRRVLKNAYDDAYNQAKSIAIAANKRLKDCVKIDFKPFTTQYVSNSSFGEERMFGIAKRSGVADTMINTFTPEDIEISETLYCLWLTE